jgi:outer membrane protein assembly factor BamB
VVAILAGVLVSAAARGSEDWTHLGGDASRQSTAVSGPNVVAASTLVWKVTTDPRDANCPFESEGATGPVVYGGKVFAYLRCGQEPNDQVAAWNADSGRLLWKTLIDPNCGGSWSTPCVDAKHNSVLIGSGFRVFALDANDGHRVWASPAVLDGSIVNASICVASDLPHARAFITDAAYQVPDGQGGHLYCINLDADEPNNPYRPGQILWAFHIGDTMGNSPSYRAGVVYVAAADRHVYAFDANAVSEPGALLWTAQCQNRVHGCFWGGVTVTPEGFLYAATYLYDLTTAENNSTLVKIDCKDGRIVWTMPSERTDTIPVVVGQMIYVSGGAAGDYGSKPKVQAFLDQGNSAKLAWDTSVSLPGEMIGSWMAQPAYAFGKLYVGAQSQPYWDSAWRPNGNGALYVLDVTKPASDGGFLFGHVEGCGNSPAVVDGSLYSTGPNALMKFHQP